MPAARWPAPAWAALIFLAFSALYVGISPSLAYQHWDSLEYTFACETRGPLATWGNHPLGQLIQCGAFEVAKRAGYAGRALPVLKAVSGVASAGAVAAFFLLMARTLGGGIGRALGWSVVLGGAFGLWQYPRAPPTSTASRCSGSSSRGGACSTTSRPAARGRQRRSQ